MNLQQFEAMPAIDVFSGADILPTSSARITSLPSRQQLDAWTQELDKIESEMEQFELGDMVRLKELARSVWADSAMFNALTSAPLYR